MGAAATRTTRWTESDSPKAPAAAGARRPTPPPFRFSRVGPKGTPLNATITRKLARAMVVGGGGDGKIPAGYTYLGQFVDHDLTMDLHRRECSARTCPPPTMLQSRSPRLDLDSLYGDGPGNPGSAKFYEADGLHLQDRDDDPGGGRDGQAAPRPAARRHGRRWRPAQKALIPDPRNDENLIVAQTHLAMINFHNKVVDKIPRPCPRRSGSPGPAGG